MTTLTLHDDGSGVLANPYGIPSEIDYATKTITVAPNCLAPIKSPVYTRQNLGSRVVGNQEITDWRLVLAGYEDGLAGYNYPAAGSQVRASYIPTTAPAPATASEETVLSTLEFDATLGYQEHISRGSLRFKLGNSIFFDTAGGIYRDPDPATGVGSVAGTLDTATGKVRLTSWVAGGANQVTLEALTTQVGSQPIDNVVFRTPVSPIKTGTMQLRWLGVDGTVYSKTPGSTGILEDSDASINIDFQRGVVRARFGLWREVSTLTDDEKLTDWYNPESFVSIGGTDYIWKPKMVSAETIVYNAVASTMLPPSSELLGLNAAKMPPDGRAVIFRDGDLALTHNSASIQKPTLAAGEVIDCGRTRLYRVVIEDSTGKRLAQDLYTVDRVSGTIAMADPLDLTGFTAPYVITHSIADLGRLHKTDITGNLSFMRPISHEYPISGSYVSGLMYIGTLQARVSLKFEQTTWTGEWSDTPIGDAPLWSYNDALYPFEVTNAGAYKDRFLFHFSISSTQFRCIGEQLGVIGEGDVNTDFSVNNPVTGVPLIMVRSAGWGSGQTVGNCLRLNLESASHPIDCVRAIQPSEPSELSDQVEILFVGNVDD